MAAQRQHAREPSEQAVRRWLGLLRQHDRLAEPELEELLRRAGRLPASATPIAVGKAGSEYLQQLIEELRPADGAGQKEQLPYLVLMHCFVQGSKSFQVANRLGLSGRQLTRERARAIGLLTAALREVPDHAVPPSPQRIPVIAEFLARANVSTALSCAIERDHLLRIHGPKGIGKTSLVADYAASVHAGGTPVLWYRFRLGLNDSLLALLYDVADLLAALHLPALASLLAEPSRPASIPVLTRQALRDLGQLPGLLVVADDYHIVEHDYELAGFLDELESRHENVRIVTIGRHDVSGDHTQYEVPPFTIAETAELLAQLDTSVTPDLAARIHQWTHGVPHLISMAGSWLQTSTREQIDAGLGSLSRLDEVQDYLLDSITELMGAVDRSILDAASIFRDRFTDEALAHVSGNTRGAVADASRYFVRFHVATRGRDGDVAFFHTSVRDYIYTRLDDTRRQNMHRRAADHYERVGNADEAAYHEQMAELLPEMQPPYPFDNPVAPATPRVSARRTPARSV